ncbi:hypothetical protein VB773_22485 [Haloarculaceae archaeon H-GB2-1]|nr:hypothetical protein [Haloarculaceae archaeon H-GB11]MEA5410068.1 hypothetical protein [Haloarculaceae archaeon H-GB2-1]
MEFGQLEGELESHDYPTTADALIDAYGDYELSLADGSVTLREVLGSQSDDVRYDDPESVRQSIFNMVGEQAVGRKDYSDRGGSDEQYSGDEANESI